MEVFHLNLNLIISKGTNIAESAQGLADVCFMQTSIVMTVANIMLRTIHGARNASVKKNHVIEFVRV